MEQLFTETLLNKLPTLNHYKQLCYSLTVRNTPYNELNMTLINKMETIENIQEYMFNIFSYKASFFKSTILSHIHHISEFKFYIAPNTYTSVLTLKQFFHCININYEYGRRRVKKCSYKYNIFYKGYKIDDIRTDTTQPPIERRYISCYGIPIQQPYTEQSADNDFRNLPITHFEQLIDIMDKDYVEDSSSFISKKYEYIFMYWEYKDIELFLEYIQKSQKYSKYSSGNYAENYLDCLEKNIQKNNYNQEKLTLLYEKYLKYETSTVLTSPLYNHYANITKILKKYIIFPVVRLGFDAVDTPTTIKDPEAAQNIIPNKELDELIDRIICVVPHLVYDRIICVVPHLVYIPKSAHEYTISDFIILESGKIIFRVKSFKNASYSYECTTYECDPNLFNKPVCMVMFSNRYTNTQFNLNSDIDMAMYYDMKSPSKFMVELEFRMPRVVNILNESHTDFIKTFIEIENNKSHIFRLYMMSNSINKKNEKILALEKMHAIECESYAEKYIELEKMHAIECESYAKKYIELENTNVELQQKCDALEMANAKLVERTKILDESNF